MAEIAPTHRPGRLAINVQFRPVIMCVTRATTTSGLLASLRRTRWTRYTAERTDPQAVQEVDWRIKAQGCS